MAEWNKMNKRWLIICLFEIILFSFVGFCVGVYTATSQTINAKSPVKVSKLEGSVFTFCNFDYVNY